MQIYLHKILPVFLLPMGISDIGFSYAKGETTF